MDPSAQSRKHLDITNCRRSVVSVVRILFHFPRSEGDNTKERGSVRDDSISSGKRVRGSTHLAKRPGNVGDDFVGVKLEDLTIDIDRVLPEQFWVGDGCQDGFGEQLWVCEWVFVRADLGIA